MKSEEGGMIWVGLFVWSVLGIWRGCACEIVRF